jgi:hypothetical protein
MLLPAHVKLREHSRQSGSHISKLLDEAYNDACWNMTFPWERRRRTLRYAERPVMYALHASILMLVHGTNRGDYSHSPRQPPISSSSVRLRTVHQCRYLSHQSLTYQAPGSSHRRVG